MIYIVKVFYFAVLLKKFPGKVEYTDEIATILGELLCCWFYHTDFFVANNNFFKQ